MTGLPVTCPGCGVSYLLPESLMGERGARVTCPACGHAFGVTTDGQLETPLPPSRSMERPAASAGRAVDADAVARELLDALAAQAGPELETAAREQRLFAEHGQAIADAFDEFKRRVGASAPTQPFREELRRRWGVDLFPAGEAKR